MNRIYWRKNKRIFKSDTISYTAISEDKKVGQVREYCGKWFFTAETNGTTYNSLWKEMPITNPNWIITPTYATMKEAKSACEEYLKSASMPNNEPSRQE